MWAATTLTMLLALKPVESIEPDTGARSWSVKSQGVSLQLTQILPDQVRGFYAARGFDAESIEYLATRHCVFQTVLRNDSANGPIRFRLADWAIERPKHKPVPLKLVHNWKPEWERRGLPPSARLAFRWAQFPAEHVYQVGDWNMGMTTYPLAPGTRFNLHVVWWQVANRREMRVTGLQCAPDAAPTERARS